MTTTRPATQTELTCSCGAHANLQTDSPLYALTEWLKTHGCGHVPPGPCTATINEGPLSSGGPLIGCGLRAGHAGAHESTGTDGRPGVVWWGGDLAQEFENLADALEVETP